MSSLKGLLGTVWFQAGVFVVQFWYLFVEKLKFQILQFWRVVLKDDFDEGEG